MNVSHREEYDKQNVLVLTALIQLMLEVLGHIPDEYIPELDDIEPMREMILKQTDGTGQVAGFSHGAISAGAILQWAKCQRPLAMRKSEQERK